LLTVIFWKADKVRLLQGHMHCFYGVASLFFHLWWSQQTTDSGRWSNLVLTSYPLWTPSKLRVVPTRLPGYAKGLTRP